MIQFNLLPDVKLEFIKTQRTKRHVIVVAGITSAVALAFLILLYSVIFAQSNHMKDLTKDIAEKSEKIKKTPDIEKVLTIQNQLNKLPELHASKPVSSRMFDYISQVTPSNVSIAAIDIDFNLTTLEITGSSDSLSSVNKYVDTLKFTDYKYEELQGDKMVTVKTRAFSEVVLTSFGRNEDDDNKAEVAKYTISFKFDKTIFDLSKQVALEIPKNFITTRSQTEKPEELFKALPTPDNASQDEGNTE